MGSGATAKYALEYPLGTDPPNVPGDIETLANQIDAILAPYSQDLIANRPAAGKAGRTFTQTDGLVGTTWRDDGAAWRALGSRIQSNAIGDIGQVIRATAGQTAHLQEWQNSAGAVLGYIQPDGTAYNPTLGIGAAVPAGSGGDALTITPGAAGSRAILAKGATGQNANLTEWQNSSGSLLANVDPTGNVRLSGAAAFLANNYMDLSANGAYMMMGGGSVSITSGGRTGGTTIVPLVVFGAAGQTADVQQWQSSQNAQVGKITKDGTFASTGPVPAFTMVDTSHSGIIATSTGRMTVWGKYGVEVRGPMGGALPGPNTGAATDPTLSVTQQTAANIALVVSGAISQTGDLQRWSDSNGTKMLSVDSNGTLADGGSTSYLFGIGTTQNYFGASAANITPLAVVGAASQTADMQQWRNSVGTSVASVQPSGQGTFTGVQSLGQNNFNQPTTQNAGAAGNIALAVRAAASQTADLQEWQLSTGTKSSWITNDGSAVLAAARVNSPDLGYLTARLSVVANSATERGVIVRGAASQSANLQEWQDSTGVSKALVGPSGLISSAVGIQSGSATFSGITWNGISNPTGTTTLPTLVTKAITSQTANLQEWHDSTGSIRAKISVGGAFSTLWDYFGYATTPASLQVATGGTGSLGVVVRAVSGQTANMQEWQNNAGTAVSYVGPGGNVAGTGGYTTLSDASVKGNVRELLHDPLDVVRRLRPVHFDYIGGMRDQVGFIANEVEPVLPHAVTPFDTLSGGIPDYEGRLGLQTDAILAYAVGAIQDIDRRLAALERAA